MVSAVPPAAPAGGQVPASRTISEFACPPAEVPEDNFADVPTTNTHEAAIDCVAWYGVTTGTSANFYSPGQPVPREQMASFIARLIDYIAARTPSTTDGLPAAPATNAFPCDVSTGSTHHASIQRLAAADVVEGKGTNGSGQACFQPGELVTRAQMATFIAKASGCSTRTCPRAPSTTTATTTATPMRPTSTPSPPSGSARGWAAARSTARTVTPPMLTSPVTRWPRSWPASSTA